MGRKIMGVPLYGLGVPLYGLGVPLYGPVDQTKYYDVLIIGTGPAGSTAAFILAGKGLNVLVIDKHKFPPKKSSAPVS